MADAMQSKETIGERTTGNLSMPGLVGGWGQVQSWSKSAGLTKSAQVQNARAGKMGISAQSSQIEGTGYRPFCACKAVVTVATQLPLQPGEATALY